ncbi:hypothetical protein Tco_1102667 [Tanacetum coccineum]
MHRIASVALVSVRDARGVLEGYERGVEGEINLPYVFVVKEREKDRSTVRIYQKSQENRQKRAIADTRNGRVQESQRFKAKVKESQLQSTEVNSLEDKS